MDIGKVIKNRRLQLNLTLEQVGELVGVGKSTVRKWENGMIENMGRDKIALLSKALNLSPLVLLGMENDEEMYSQANISFIKVPLYGDISCGTGMFVEDNIIDYVAIPDDGLSTNREYFAQIASGDSMTGAGIFADDILIVDRSIEPQNGDIVIAVLNNEFTVKRLEKSDSRVELKSENPNYPSIIIPQDMELQIWGVVKHTLRTV